MLLDAFLHIVVDIGRYDDSILCASVHRLGVDVVMVVIVLHKPSVALEGIEVFHCLVVDPRIMLVGRRVEVDLRLDDVVQRFGVAVGLTPRFIGIEHVVGARCHLFNQFSWGTYAPEGFDFCHNVRYQLR